MEKYKDQYKDKDKMLHDSGHLHQSGYSSDDDDEDKDTQIQRQRQEKYKDQYTSLDNPTVSHRSPHKSSIFCLAM